MVYEKGQPGSVDICTDVGKGCINTDPGESKILRRYCERLETRAMLYLSELRFDHVITKAKPSNLWIVSGFILIIMTTRLNRGEAWSGA